MKKEGVDPAALAEAIAGLRIPYLHWLLLGFITLGLVSAAQEKWGEEAIPGRRWMTRLERSACPRH